MNRILYIEDDEGETVVLKRLYPIVRKKFHGEVEVLSAATWEEGAEVVERDKPDVVILDLALPPTSNSEQTLARMAIKAPTWPPILVLTGNAYDLSLRKRAMSAGADDFMLKEEARHGLYENLVERVYNAYLRRQYRDGKRTRLQSAE